MAVAKTPHFDQHRVHPRTADLVRREISHESDVLDVLTGRAASQRRRRPTGVLPVVRVAMFLVLGLWLTWTAALRWLTPTQIWIGYALAGALALTGLAQWRRRSALPLAALVLMWGTWAATYPWWSAWDPDVVAVQRTAHLFRINGVACLLLVALAGLAPSGVRTLRLLWIAIAAGLLPFTLTEVLTGWHMTYGAPYGPAQHTPSGPFGNPNNLACVLVVCAGVALGRATERIGRVRRSGLLILVGLLTWMIVATQSRSSIVVLIVLAAGAGVLALSRSRARRALRDPRLLTALALAATACVVVPGLRRLNPLWTLLFPGTDDIVRSDTLRVRLAQIALDAWQAHPWTGIGIGRFQHILEHDHPEIGHVVPVHHTFIEILAEMGLIALLPLLAVLALAIWAALAPHRKTRPSVAHRHGRPASLDTAGLRYLTFVHLSGFVLAGIVMSSALTWPVWSLMLASVAICAGRLTEVRMKLRNGPAKKGSGRISRTADQFKS